MNKGPDLLPRELLATYHVFPRSFPTAERVSVGGWGVTLLLSQAFLSAATTGCLLRLKVALAAPPVDGEANKTLIKFMAEVLGVPKNSVSVASGATGRRKVVAVDGLSCEAAAARLAELVK